MVSYIAHIPHSPALLPAISKHRAPLFNKLRAAIKHIAADMYVKKVSTVIFITPSAYGSASSHIIHFAPRYIARFRHLGEFDTTKEIEGDAVIAHAIRSKTALEHPIKIVSNEHIDHASASAALLLLKAFKFKTVPISYALDGFESLNRFGSVLREALETQPQNVAVVSLGDFSRGSGTGETARAFDESVLASLNHVSIEHLEQFDRENIHHSLSALRPLAVLSGVLDGVQYARDVLCYEQKQNVGMAVIRFCF